ncbi:hypothetical protein OF83DRAFT_138748 [Amylostereum chailletii]|nr:hypothetical protein OF83DRAFT_138748 [Amylostereum chailletii]
MHYHHPLLSRRSCGFGIFNPRMKHSNKVLHVAIVVTQDAPNMPFYFPRFNPIIKPRSVSPPDRPRFSWMAQHVGWLLMRTGVLCLSSARGSRAMHIGKRNNEDEIHDLLP